MTKDKWLEKLAFAKSDIGVLIASTRAGVEKVHLEEIEEKMQALYNKVADMPQERFDFVSNT